MVSKGDFALIHENQDSAFQYDQIKRSPGSIHDDKRWLQLKLVLFRHCCWHHKYHHVLCKLQCALKVVILVTRSIFFSLLGVHYGTGLLDIKGNCNMLKRIMLNCSIIKLAIKDLVKWDTIPWFVIFWSLLFHPGCFKVLIFFLSVCLLMGGLGSQKTYDSLFI